MPLKVPSALCCMNETVKYRRGGAFLEREKRREREWNENQLEGRNAVLEVLRSGRDIEKIMVQKGNVEGTIKRIVAQAAEKGVVIQEVSRQKLDELSQTKNHQGVIALVSAHEREKTPLSSFWMVSRIRIIWARFSERRNVPARMA